MPGRRPRPDGRPGSPLCLPLAMTAEDRAGPSPAWSSGWLILTSVASALFRLPEDLGDVVDLGEQFLGRGHVRAGLRATATAGQLGRLVEHLVELRVLLEVRRLEVVRPQRPQVMLDELGPLLLDQQRALPEHGIGVVTVLLADRLDGLGLDPRLGGVVHAAGEVTVRVRSGPRLENTGGHPHAPPSSRADPRYPPPPTLA